jgi:preprotein translocase subunit SecG
MTLRIKKTLEILIKTTILAAALLFILSIIAGYLSGPF